VAALMNRTDYVRKLNFYRDRDLIKVVTGLRRSGKSTLLELFRRDLVEGGVGPDQIHAYNFELPEHYLGKTWDGLYFEIKERLAPGVSNYVFLDEVQNIAQFEKLVDGLHATPNVDVYLTGSNAYLLGTELATLLTGRYVELSILPFSFREYLEARGVDTAQTYLNYEGLFFDYVNETSLPKGVELRSGGLGVVYDYLEAIFASVVEKDIAQRYEIRDRRAFANTVRFLATQVGTAVSPSNIARAMKADGQTVHHSTVERFLDYLVGSFVFYRVHRFDLKGRRQLATQEKYYAVDPGLLNLLAGRERTADRGHWLENVVYLELLRRGYRVWVGTSRTGEVDFVCKASNGDLAYYQVAWTLTDPETANREWRSLERIADHYPKWVLSTDSYVEGRRGIQHQNAFAWLLQENQNAPTQLP
jgi:predicted AAA+ superfamily ATPase